MTAHYSNFLEEHVQRELTEAISEAALKAPKDAVDYIGNYLLKIVNDDAKKKERVVMQEGWAKEDEELEAKRKEEEEIARKKQEDDANEKLKDEQFYADLLKCSNKSEAMQAWSEYMENKTKSSSVYIGIPCMVKEDDEEKKALLYDAVSCKDNEFLKNTTFIQSETKGIVFDLLKEEENENDEEEEEDEDENKPKVEEIKKPRKNIHIKNVLLPNAYKDRLHFFKYPKVGSFLSFESCIKSYLNDEAIQAQLRPQWPRPIEEILAEQKEKEEAEKKAKEEAERKAKEESANNDDEAQKEEDTQAPKEEEPEKEEAEAEEEEDEEVEEKEEEVLAPDPIQISKKYVISMDTLGSEQLYNQEIIQWIDESITKFEDVLMKIDVMQYLQQREFEENLKTKLNEYEEKTKGEIEAKIAEIEKENEESAEEIKSFQKQHHMIIATQSIWSLISSHAMKPEQSSYCKIIAAFIKLFDLKQSNSLSLINSQLSQLDAISNAAWNQCLACLKNITLEEVTSFVPSEIESFDTSFIEQLIGGVNAEDIGNEGIALVISMMYQFVDSSCKYFKFIEEEKKKREAAEKEKADVSNDNKDEVEEEDADAENE